MKNFFEIIGWVVGGIVGLGFVLWLMAWIAMFATLPFVYFDWLFA